FFFSSRRRHTRSKRDWSSDVCSSDLKAEEEGLTPQAFVDRQADDIQALWEKLEITNDKFIRTTDGYHKEAVANIFEVLLEKGDRSEERRVGKKRGVQSSRYHRLEDDE